MKLRLCLLLPILALSTLLHASTKAATDIVLNGVAVKAYFNDGDTFKVLSGPLKGKRSRLLGYNTLESYGPVHRWGEFTHAQLMKIANESTVLARKGGWHCTTDGAQDIYGRILSECEDLGVELVKKGLAHVMTVTEEPGPLLLVKAQKEAIAKRVGMWELGVPSFILTSVHSFDEFRGKSMAYNRFVSTLDGHSELELHKNVYKNCEEVCEAPSEGSLEESLGDRSCMIYVSSKNRFGRNRASCLRSN